MTLTKGEEYLLSVEIIDAEVRHNNSIVRARLPEGSVFTMRDHALHMLHPRVRKTAIKAGERYDIPITLISIDGSKEEPEFWVQIDYEGSIVLTKEQARQMRPLPY